MNLNNVKYPYVIAKFKNGGWELMLGNFERMREAELENLYHKLQLALHQLKTLAVRKRRLELEQAEESAA